MKWLGRPKASHSSRRDHKKGKPSCQRFGPFFAPPVADLTLLFIVPILNLMVKYQDTMLDRTFSALADPTRRAMLGQLHRRAGVSISDLARPFSMSLPAVMKHLDVLSDAGLITRSKAGRTVTCQLAAAPMEQAMHWLNHYQRFWSDQLDRLAAFVEDDSCPPQPDSPKSPASPSNVVSMPRRKKSTPPGPTPKKS
jgi:DNA-binding transcriptional ArsR family regulator